MGRWWCSALVVLTVPATAQAEPAVTVEARGNAFTGGLEFAPRDVGVRVGEEVAWVNRDFLVPHTVVERHRLWALEGDYGGTPANPSGFPPGATVSRAFEAGTHEYLCTVHPEDMQGTVAVPVQLAAERTRLRRAPTRRDRRRSRLVAHVIARWSADPEEDQAFDAQRRRPGGQWIPLARATPFATARFRTRPGLTWEVRARLRAADGDAATEWSPVERVRG